MKTHPRLLSCAVTALALLTLTTGCPDKLKNLKAKAEECERELKSINSETDKIQTKIDKVAAWERLSPPPATAIAIQRTEIEREQRAVDAEHDVMTNKLGEIIKEFKELNDIELSEVGSYLTNVFPLLLDALLKRFGIITNALQLIQDQVPSKLNQQQSMVSQETNLIQAIDTLPPGPARNQALDQLALLQAQASGISFIPEIQAAGRISAELEAVGALPVLAGSFVPQTSLVLEEGFPDSLSYLESGVLAPGTEIKFQLPEGWYITAPVTATSSNLVLQITGNQAGTNAFTIHVVGEINPGLTNDNITVVFHGVRIGPNPGHAEACMFVNPGRAQKVDFCVFPDPPPSFSPPTLQPGGMRLSWQGRGTLEQGPSVRGPYTNSLNQANPQVVPITDPSRFFRVSRP